MRTSKSFVLVPGALAAIAGLLLAPGAASAQTSPPAPPGSAELPPPDVPKPRPIVVSTQPQPLPPPAPAEPPPEPKRYGNGLRPAGIVLTTLAGLLLVAGVSIIAVDQSNKDADLYGLASAAIGAPLMIGSALFGGVGAALWVSGAPAPPAVAGMPASAPAVAAGPRSVALRWAF